MLNKELKNTSVNLSGVILDNPVIPASGTFGYGQEFARLYDLNILGSISFKGTTLEPRFGNPQPRIAECPGGLINSVGLQNPGLEKVISEELPALGRIYKKPLIANISGFSIDEYVKCAEAMDRQKQVGIIEANVSCPNVHNGGMAYGVDPKSAAEVTNAVRKATKKPLYIKLSPNVTDITEIAKACESAGADGLSLINTMLGMRIDIKSRSPVIANKMGGLSGPAIFPIAVRMVYQVAKAVKLPIIGMGGISSAKDVIEMMMAGATATQVGAANLMNPMICRDIIEELPVLMEKLKINRLEEIIGIVQ
ncbi:MAG: dihydroorotate dehydrogenase [Anaerovoracaceae bacterium]|nr:dihydroorotate dehydrogenase [Anaerovoracaceae bacterium]